jgi:demethylmenaquinone methyltransferase / 2-methoxy-6-polyprenyl-1,4-benzoquinol methylase
MGPRSNPALEGSPLGSPSEIAVTARSVRNMFEAVTPRYDFLNHFLSAGCDVYWRWVTARSLRPALSRPNCVIFDVCCGTGDLAFAFRRVSAAIVLGTDFCEPMLLRARDKARNGSRPVAFIGADTLELPFRDNTADVVASAFGFRNLANYALGLREMLRVLKPGGRVAILEFSRARWPVFAPLFRLYFAHILPRLGSWISGVQGAYQYLHESVSRFPDQEALAKNMRRAGFIEVAYRNLMGGVAALHEGTKPT